MELKVWYILYIYIRVHLLDIIRQLDMIKFP